MDGEDLPNSVARPAKARTPKHRHYLKTLVRLAAFLANLKRSLAAPKNCVDCVGRPTVKRLLGYHGNLLKALEANRERSAAGRWPQGDPGWRVVSVRAHGLAPLRVNSCSPGSHGFPVPASLLRAKPRCALKSTDSQITSLSPRQIRSTYDQGLGEPKITGPGREYANHHLWNQHDESIPAEPCGSVFRSAMGLRAKPRCVLKSTDTKTTVPFPRRSA
jgi:hypothetical protein